GSQSFADVLPPRLRFHIAASPTVSGVLYELLINNTIQLAVVPEGESVPSALRPAGTVRAVGFAADEGVLPSPPQAHLGYRLIQEYFCFPKKFLFFDLDPLPALGAGRAVDILFLLDTVPSERL